jgi:xanthine dehydrogenase accessory factor
LVSFAQAIFDGECTLEGVRSTRVVNLEGVEEALDKDLIPILVDPECQILQALKGIHLANQPFILVDARMTKHRPEAELEPAELVIGLGPGFIAGENCHAVVETKRGHTMGRVIWNGEPEPDTGEPEGFGEEFRERVLRAPSEGTFDPLKQICDHLKTGELIATVNGSTLTAPFEGVLRGLLYPKLHVQKNQKVGDLDPRIDEGLCTLVSDKSLAVSGGVLEAILSRKELRAHLWRGSL